MKCAECADRWKCGAGYDLRRKRRNCEKAKKPAKRSNADRIRAMTDEELARMLARGCHETRECPTICAPIYPYDEVVESCEKCWLEWLKQESEGE